MINISCYVIHIDINDHIVRSSVGELEGERLRALRVPNPIQMISFYRLVSVAATTRWNEREPSPTAAHFKVGPSINWAVNGINLNQRLETARREK
jgi:hypothetical protein